MASAQVVETSVANNSPSQDSNHPDDHFQPRYVTPGFKPFSYLIIIIKILPRGKHIIRSSPAVYGNAEFNKISCYFLLLG